MAKQAQFILDWNRLDPEAKCGLDAALFTGVGNLASIMGGVVLTLACYGALYPLYTLHRWQMVDMFFPGGEANRSLIPAFTVFLSCWCLAFLWLKKKKLRVQRQALGFDIIPQAWENNYTISPQNSPEILRLLHTRISDSSKFMLLNRVEQALGNLKNIGRIADVSNIFRDLAADDANYMESTYTLPKGLIWAIPVTGFIGTVLGLSQAVGGFGAVVAGGTDLTALKNALGGVTGGLATAFETTLIALVAALFIQLLMTFLMQKEETFLNECADYCQEKITSRLRILEGGDEWE